jgi:integrase
VSESGLDNGGVDGGFVGRVRSTGGATIPSDKTACAAGDPVPAGGTDRAARVQLVVIPGGERTWTVLGADRLPVEPVEGFLEYLRVLGRSPNTVKSYARALALWWQFLALYGLGWDAVKLEDFGSFLGWLRTGDTPTVASIEPRPARFSEETVAVRLQAVASFYRYHHFNGVEAASSLYERAFRPGRPYKPMLEHLARRRGTTRSVVHVSRRRRASPPTLTPEQIEAILDACARWDEAAREWRGSVRDRLLWAMLAETGVRLGEALGLQHRDWHTGLGDTPWIEVVPRDHPHGVRVKGQAYRRLFISDELDRLYGDYLFELCERGVDLVVEDLDAHWVFVNLEREPRFAPLRAETVRGQVLRLRRDLAGQVPDRFTPVTGPRLSVHHE